MSLEDQSLTAFIAWAALTLLGLIIFTIYWILVIRYGVKLGMRAAQRERDEERAELQQHRYEDTRTRIVPRQQ